MSWIDRARTRWLLGLLLVAGAAFWGAYALRNVALGFAGLTFVAASIGVAATRLASLSVVFAASFFALSLAEVAAGVFLAAGNVPSAHPDPNAGYSRPGYFTATDIGYQGKPGVYTSRMLAPDGSVIYDVTYSIGDDGFRRGEEHDLPSQKRVNFFGCSFTFGEGLNDDQTLPHYVHEALSGVKVKNFGFHGYGVQQALAILQSQRDTNGNVNFLLTAPWHAERSACKVSYSQRSPRYVLNESGELVRSGICPPSRLEYSKLYQLVSAQANELNRDADFRLYVALVREMGRLSKQRGQKFVVGFVKADEDYFKGSSFSNEKIFSALKDSADETIDLTLAGKAEDQERKYYIHPLDRHPSAQANMARAKILAPILARDVAQ